MNSQGPFTPFTPPGGPLEIYSPAPINGVSSFSVTFSGNSLVPAFKGDFSTFDGLVYYVGSPIGTYYQTKTTKARSYNGKVLVVSK